MVRWSRSLEKLAPAGEKQDIAFRKKNRMPTRARWPLWLHPLFVMSPQWTIFSLYAMGPWWTITPSTGYFKVFSCLEPLQQLLFPPGTWLSWLPGLHGSFPFSKSVITSSSLCWNSPFILVLHSFVLCPLNPSFASNSFSLFLSFPWPEPTITGERSGLLGNPECLPSSFYETTSNRPKQHAPKSSSLVFLRGLATPMKTGPGFPVIQAPAGPWDTLHYPTLHRYQRQSLLRVCFPSILLAQILRPHVQFIAPLIPRAFQRSWGHSSFCHWPVWLWSSLSPFQFWFSHQWNARVGLVISGFTSNHGHHPSQLSHPLNDSWLNGHEFEQTLGHSDRQGSLVCCSPLGHRFGHNLATWISTTRHTDMLIEAQNISGTSPKKWTGVSCGECMWDSGVLDVQTLLLYIQPALQWVLLCTVAGICSDGSAPFLQL